MVSLTIAQPVDITAESLPSWGINLSGISQRETPRFINRMLGARRPVREDFSALDEQYFGADKNVTSLPGGDSGWLIIFSTTTGANTGYRGGNFTLTWEGDAANAATITVQTVAATSNVVNTDHQVVFDWDATNTSTMWVHVNNPDMADPPKNFVMVRTNQLALHAAGNIFDPDMAAEIAPYAFYRFMDWQGTNGNDQTAWSEEPNASDAYWLHTHVPVSAMVALCNLNSADMWVCMPQACTDDYVTQFATFVKANLSNDLDVYVEYSNEVWNSWFSARAYTSTQADAEWGLTTDEAKLSWAGKRSTEIIALWNTVFAGQNKRVHGVLGVQTANTTRGIYMLDAPTWLAQDPGSHVYPYSVHEFCGVTGYFGGGVIAANLAEIETDIAVSEATAVATILGYLPAEVTTAISYFAAYKTVVEARNMRMIQYEANQSMRMDEASASSVLYSGGAPTAAFVSLMDAVTYSTEMAGFHEDIFDGFKLNGGTYSCFFNDYRLNGNSGGWGLRQYRGETNNVATKVETLNTNNPRWWTKYPS